MYSLCIIIFIVAISVPRSSSAQHAYFADGFHGGVWGHYPDHYTKYIIQQVKQHPEWAINMEIEPETWDSVQVQFPDEYREFKNLLNNPAYKNRIEFVNPSYAQSYLYNISGESIIRQFQHGMEKIHSHFPGVRFSTYSSEEPCFTSALPQVLQSLGINHAVLKNPNTCWGGYCKSHGGELINWVGPDGTTIKTVPRYASETLTQNSTWQTEAWNNSNSYIQDALQQGIKHPVGMTYQDAGWRRGPWLGEKARAQYQPTSYTTWRNYFENIAPRNVSDNWSLNQEDIQVSLMWGSQVLQRIAQEVRQTENNLIQTEKLASVATIYQGVDYPDSLMDRAWRNLLMSQHHDCWIVPYNRHRGSTWAEHVRNWTDESNAISYELITQSARQLLSVENTNHSSQQYVRVFNVMGHQRDELIKVPLPDELKKEDYIVAKNQAGKSFSTQVIKDSVLFQASVPALGYDNYQLMTGNNSILSNRATVRKQRNGKYIIETDLYKLVVNPAEGGTIEHLVSKKSGNKEFVDQSSERALNELRGFFYDERTFHSSTEQPAKVTVMEDGPLRVRLKVEGYIASNPFTQMITLTQGQPRIDFNLNIDWKGNPGIGKFSQEHNYDAKDQVKAFYNNKYKLQTLFPLNLDKQRVYKNAPFSVMESHLDRTFFDRWDNIKNTVILNWVDVTDTKNKFGLALLTDHTGSYAHGKNFPLGLTTQYIGKGLWGRDYRIEGSTHISYAIIPHRGRWDKAGIWEQSNQWSHPLMIQQISKDAFAQGEKKSFINIDDPGIVLSSLTIDHNDLLIRLFNVSGSGPTHNIILNGQAQQASLVELNGRKRKKLKINKMDNGQLSVEVKIPRFGIRTIKLKNLKPGKL